MYQRILVPFDGSATSLRGLEEAIKFARSSGAALRLVHVLDDFLYAVGIEGNVAYSRDVLPDLRRGAEAILKTGRDRAAAAGVTAETVLVECVGGRLADVVDEQVRSWHADLVVMGSHGRRGAIRALLGSDAEQVLRRSRVPVLLVRAPTDEAPGPKSAASTPATAAG